MPVDTTMANQLITHVKCNLEKKNTIEEGWGDGNRNKKKLNNIKNEKGRGTNKNTMIRRRKIEAKWVSTSTLHACMMGSISRLRSAYLGQV